MCILVHSPWLPGYIDITQTILAILTVAGLFPDRTSHIMRVVVLIWPPKAQDWRVLVEAVTKAKRDLRKICGIWLTSPGGKGLKVGSRGVYAYERREYYSHVLVFCK